MMRLRLFAPAIALAAMAVFGLPGDSMAARKTWAEQCNEKPRDQRDRCCTTKTLDCYAMCFEQFGNYGYRSDECIRLCKSSSEACHKSIDKTSLSGGPGTSKQAPKTSRSRVCCRTGQRHAWMSVRDCRARKGRSVRESFCRNSKRLRDHRTRRTNTSVCCQKGTRKWLTTQRDCRSRGGRTVNGRHCVRR